MKLSIKQILITLLFFSSINVSSQGRFYHVDATEGLTNLHITSITQDKSGFIWIGTSDGLFRYDGYSIKPFYNEINNTHSLSNNSISYLLSDSKGRLWIATSQGLNLYNPKYETFERAFPDSGKPGSLPNMRVSCIYEDRKGNIWVGHFDGLSMLNNAVGKSNEFTFVNYKPVAGSDVMNWINSICEDKNGEIWFSSKFRGLYHLNPRSGKIDQLYKTGMQSDFRITGMIRDSADNILASSFHGDGVLRVKKEKNALERLQVEGKEFQMPLVNIFLDSRKRTWILTEKGLYLSDHNNTTLFKHDSSNKYSLSSSAVNCIYEDRSGLMWIGTNGKGVDIYREQTILINSYTHETNTGMPDNLIVSMLYLNNSLYFNSIYNGLFELRENKIIKKNIQRANVPLVFNGVNKIFCNKVFFNVNTDKIYELELKKTKRLGISCSDNKGFIYLLAENNHIITFDNDGKLVREEKTFNLPGAKNNVSNFIHFDWYGDNRFLLLDKQNLFIYDTLKGVLTEVVKLSEFDNCKYTFSFMHRHDNDIWFVAKHIIYHYHLTKGYIRSYNTDKIWGDIINSVITDNDGDVWFASNKGIILLYTRQNKSYLFDKSDGVYSNILTRAAAISPENVLYFGTSDGIIEIHKKTLRPEKNVAPIVLTNFQLFNRNVPVSVNDKKEKEFCLSSHINETDEIILNHHQNYLSIEFAALNYISGTKNKYAFSLAGQDQSAAGWNYVGSDRKATFNGLPPGRYVFRIKASNNDGVWSKRQKDLIIIITPPFWQTWWFRTLMVIFLISSVYLFFAARLHNIRQKKVELEKEVRIRTAEIVAQKEEIQTHAENLQEINTLLKESQEEIKTQATELYSANIELNKLNSTKDKFFSIIAHDLKNPFQAIIGLSDLLIENHKEIEKDKISEYAGYIRNSSRMAYSLLENLLEWARTQTGRITFEPRIITLHSVASETIELLSVNAKNKNLTIVNSVPQNLFAFADKNMVTTIFRNLLNNAIKFTPLGGKIAFIGKAGHQFSEVTIEDNGVGMEESIRSKLFRIDQHITSSGTSGESGTGLGLIITKEFLDKNSGTILVESEPGKGSRFIIHLPVANNSQMAQQTTETTPTITEVKDQISHGKLTENEKPATGEGITLSLKEKPLLLIAEDTQEIRLAIKSYLENDYRIVEAEDGEEALKFAVELIPDLIISDWMMPKMDGIELCKHLKTNTHTSHIPVVMLTAKSTSLNKIQGFETGADEYMTKPFEYPLLRARLKNLILSRIALQKKYSINASEEERKINITGIDQKFMDSLISLIDKNLDNSELNINDFCEELGISRSPFYRKLTAITGQSPVIFLRNYRLNKAAQLIEENGENISGIMYQVGFNNKSYFAKSFKELFGCTPSEYAAKKTTK